MGKIIESASLEGLKNMQRLANGNLLAMQTNNLLPFSATRGLRLGNIPFCFCTDILIHKNIIKKLIVGSMFSVLPYPQPFQL